VYSEGGGDEEDLGESGESEGGMSSWEGSVWFEGRKSEGEDGREDGGDDDDEGEGQERDERAERW